MKKAYPQASEWLAQVVLQRGWADEITGCCRTNHQVLTGEDTALCICSNCMAMISEDTPQAGLESLWMKMDASDLPLPDYGGITVGLQDCGRAYDRADVQDAVRSLLAKMNIDVVELPDARDKSIFCGASFLGAAPAQDAGFAPKRYVEGAAQRGFFTNIPDDQRQAALEEHCARIEPDVVVSYCTACDAGLQAGGKKSIALLDLVAGTANF